MTFNHLKTNSAKLSHYRRKIRNVIEFFNFQSLVQLPPLVLNHSEVAMMNYFDHSPRTVPYVLSTYVNEISQITSTHFEQFYHPNILRLTGKIRLCVSRNFLTLIKTYFDLICQILLFDIRLLVSPICMSVFLDAFACQEKTV